jgi:hypothetical protein
MNLEQIVTSLDLSKKLKELGVKKESYFAWFNIPYAEKWEVMLQTKSLIGLPCYTASELLELLPKFIDKNGLNYSFGIVPSGEKEWYVGYNDKLNKIELKNLWDKNICNALAKMVIYLTENKILYLG